MSATAKLPVVLERHVTEQVIGWLRLKGWTCERVQSGLLKTADGRTIRIGKRGISDWNCFKGPQYFKLELKAPGKLMSAKQVEYFDTCMRDGLNIMWADGLGMFLAKYEAGLWDNATCRRAVGTK